jgi:hypothetical protein
MLKIKPCLCDVDPWLGCSILRRMRDVVVDGDEAGEESGEDEC